MDKSRQPKAFVFYWSVGSIKLNLKVIRYNCSSMRSMNQRLVNMHSVKLKIRCRLELVSDTDYR